MYSGPSQIWPPLGSQTVQITETFRFVSGAMIDIDCSIRAYRSFASITSSLDYPNIRVRGAPMAICKDSLYCTVLTSGVIINVRWCLLSRKYCWIFSCKKVGDLSNSCNINTKHCKLHGNSKIGSISCNNTIVKQYAVYALEIIHSIYDVNLVYVWVYMYMQWNFSYPHQMGLGVVHKSEKSISLKKPTPCTQLQEQSLL